MNFPVWLISKTYTCRFLYKNPSDAQITLLLLLSSCGVVYIRFSFLILYFKIEKIKMGRSCCALLILPLRLVSSQTGGIKFSSVLAYIFFFLSVKDRSSHGRGEKSRRNSTKKIVVFFSFRFSSVTLSLCVPWRLPGYSV